MKCGIVGFLSMMQMMENKIWKSLNTFLVV